LASANADQAFLRSLLPTPPLSLGRLFSDSSVPNSLQLKYFLFREQRPPRGIRYLHRKSDIYAGGGGRGGARKERKRAGRKRPLIVEKIGGGGGTAHAAQRHYKQRMLHALLPLQKRCGETKKLFANRTRIGGSVWRICYELNTREDFHRKLFRLDSG